MKDTLTQSDLIKWGKDIVIYCLIPTAIVFLTSLQAGKLDLALGAAYAALISSAINLLRKYSAGVEPTVINQTVSTTPVTKVGE